MGSRVFFFFGVGGFWGWCDILVCAVMGVFVVVMDYYLVGAVLLYWYRLIGGDWFEYCFFVYLGDGYRDVAVDYVV